MHPMVIHCFHTVHLIQQKKPEYYSGKNCTKTFCLDLRELTIKRINYEKKK